MARLPTPGGDNGNWGTILNDYLSQALDTDGTIKDGVVTANTLAPNSVTNTTIATNAVNATSIANGSITETLLASAVQTKLNSLTISDAGTWSTSSTYSAGRIVNYGGSRYITPSGAPANSFFDTSKWVLIGSAPDVF